MFHIMIEIQILINMLNVVKSITEENTIIFPAPYPYF